MRVAKLIMVEIDTKQGCKQSNKYYNMTENADGSINVEYGRIGATKQTESYPTGTKSFDSILKAKVKKGYKDITSLKQVDDQSNNSSDIYNGVEKEVKSLLEFLLDCSKNIVKNNYLSTTDDVTEKQIIEAQALINKSINYLTTSGNKNELNRVLLDLYAILPRKMKNVKDYLVENLNSLNDVDDARKLIDNEQSLLSTLESQILTNKQTSVSSKSGSNILQEMDVEMYLVKDASEIKKVKDMMTYDNQKMVRNIYKVTNKQTQKVFEEHVATCKDKTTQLLFHGSRNNNWIGLIQKGLLIRPANAIISGAMFGNGIYGANKSQKSLGYSSLSGSYWTKGNDNRGFLALYEFHTGKQKHVREHGSSCYSLHETVSKEGYDSVYAHEGKSLRNDEFIVYDIKKTTIKYLIEMGN